MAGNISIQIEGKSYDLDDFELGDLEWLEEHVGGPLADENVLTSMRSLVGFVYLIKRRDNPKFTLEEARKIKMGALDPDAADESTPAKPAGKRPTKAAARS